MGLIRKIGRVLAWPVRAPVKALGRVFGRSAADAAHDRAREVLGPKPEGYTMKPGYKTTEFWLAAVASIIGVLMQSGAVQTDSEIGKVVALIAAALASLGYSVSRGLAKRGQ